MPVYFLGLFKFLTQNYVEGMGPDRCAADVIVVALRINEEQLDCAIL